MPRGVRRSEPEHPAAGTVIGTDAIRPALDVERGLVHGSSNPAATDGHLGEYHDTAAEIAKPDRPSQQSSGPPFDLTK